MVFHGKLHVFFKGITDGKHRNGGLHAKVTDIRWSDTLVHGSGLVLSIAVNKSCRSEVVHKAECCAKVLNCPTGLLFGCHSRKGKMFTEDSDDGFGGACC